ncbi:ABC transporter ATP-binding protein [Carnobacterium gallinarum]|uniref:ABC transporter ATP-binding protein n=1 Tax=Carnobacterium gallinarum TaxID=2749 RepID=UPI0005508056|nr:ATP-binding cassette domain-containing protein [Carnobacterium gallinarum]
MIELTNLTIATNEALIIDATINLKIHNIYGLSAPNGSGKSTLMRVLSGLLNQHSGTVTFYNEQEKKLSNVQIKKDLFYFETSNWLDGNLTGLDYLKLINALWEGEKDSINQVIHFWGMEHYITKPIKKYSLGMKQKVLLSLYTVSNTRYWILDEPTLALDKASVTLLTRYIDDARNSGKMVLFSSHAGDELFSSCDTLLAIEDRKLILTGGN